MIQEIDYNKMHDLGINTAEADAYYNTLCVTQLALMSLKELKNNEDCKEYVDKIGLKDEGYETLTNILRRVFVNCSEIYEDEAKTEYDYVSTIAPIMIAAEVVLENLEPSAIEENLSDADECLEYDTEISDEVKELKQKEYSIEYLIRYLEFLKFIAAEMYKRYNERYLDETYFAARTLAESDNDAIVKFIQYVLYFIGFESVVVSDENLNYTMSKDVAEALFNKGIAKIYDDETHNELSDMCERIIDYFEDYETDESILQEAVNKLSKINTSVQRANIDEILDFKSENIEFEERYTPLLLAGIIATTAEKPLMA